MTHSHSGSTSETVDTTAARTTRGRTRLAGAHARASPEPVVDVPHASSTEVLSGRADEGRHPAVRAATRGGPAAVGGTAPRTPDRVRPASAAGAGLGQRPASLVRAVRIARAASRTQAGPGWSGRRGVSVSTIMLSGGPLNPMDPGPAAVRPPRTSCATSHPAERPPTRHSRPAQRSGPACVRGRSSPQHGFTATVCGALPNLDRRRRNAQLPTRFPSAGPEAGAASPPWVTGAGAPPAGGCGGGGRPPPGAGRRG